MILNDAPLFHEIEEVFVEGWDDFRFLCSLKNLLVNQKRHKKC